MLLRDHPLTNHSTLTSHANHANHFFGLMDDYYPTLIQPNSFICNWKYSKQHANMVIYP